MRARTALGTALLVTVAAVLPAGPALAASWTVQPTPDAGSRLDGVAASGGTAWAVGSTETGRALVARWSGGAWSLVDTPALPGGAAEDRDGIRCCESRPT